MTEVDTTQTFFQVQVKGAPIQLIWAVADNFKTLTEAQLFVEKYVKAELEWRIMQAIVLESHTQG